MSVIGTTPAWRTPLGSACGVGQNKGHVRRHNCMHILVAIILRGVLAAVLCFVCSDSSDPVTMAEHYTAAPPTPSILHSGPVSVVHSSFQAGPRNDCQEPFNPGPGAQSSLQTLIDRVPMADNSAGAYWP